MPIQHKKKGNHFTVMYLKTAAQVTIEAMFSEV